jgi:hypothetical protein
MKTTMSKIVLIAICLFTIQFNATAQIGKVLRPRTTAPATQVPVSVALKDTTLKVYSTANVGTLANSEAVDAIAAVGVYNGVKNPKQDPSLGMISGKIIIDEDVDLPTYGLTLNQPSDQNQGNGFRKFMLLSPVKENPVPNNTGTSTGGLIATWTKFSLGWDFATNPVEITTYSPVMVTKVNDRLYTFKAFNVPLNAKYTFVLSDSYWGNPDRKPEGYVSFFQQNKITNAYFTSEQSLHGIDIMNIQLFEANKTSVYPTVTIKRPQQVN